MTMKASPSILAVILNYRTPEMTLRSARSVLQAMSGMNGTLAIVDNASGDGSFEIIHAAALENGWIASGRVEVIQSGHNGGFGAGNNVGINSQLLSATPPDFYYIVNSDAFPKPNALRALLQHMSRSPETGIAGSYIFGEDGKVHSTAFRFPSILGELEEAACTGIITRLLRSKRVSVGKLEESQDVEWLAGASMLIRREMLEEVGLFDERFFLYYEETDLCRRALNHGWNAHYVRESEVMHIGSVSTGMKKWARTPQYWFDSRLRYFTKTHGPVYAFVATLAHVSGALLYRLRRLVGRKPRLDPPHFLRDMISHYVRSIVKAVAKRFSPDRSERTAQSNISKPECN